MPTFCTLCRRTRRASAVPGSSRSILCVSNRCRSRDNRKRNYFVSYHSFLHKIKYTFLSVLLAPGEMSSSSPPKKKNHPTKSTADGLSQSAIADIFVLSSNPNGYGTILLDTKTMISSTSTSPSSDVWIHLNIDICRRATIFRTCWFHEHSIWRMNSINTDKY